MYKSIQFSELIIRFREIFKDDFDYYKVRNSVQFLMVEKNANASNELNEKQKEIAISLICQNLYQEDDIIHLRMSKMMNEGWAFTKDSFCICTNDGIKRKIIPYEKMAVVPSLTKEFANEYLPLYDDSIPRIGLKSGNCAVVNDYGILFPDGSNAILYSEMLGSSLQTCIALEKFLKELKNCCSKK